MLGRFYVMCPEKKTMKAQIPVGTVLGSAITELKAFREFTSSEDVC